MPSYKATVIILNRKNLFEADRLITAFSFEFGLIRFVAKGVRRVQSKFAGMMEPFCQTRVILAKGRNLDILTSAELENNFLANTAQLEKIKIASLIAEITNKMGVEGQKNTKLYNLLIDVSKNINEYEEKLILAFFLVNLFQLSGDLPETNNCIKCGERPENTIYFSFEGGGILDENCAEFFEDSREIKIEILKYINYLRKNSLQKSSKLIARQEVYDEVDKLLLNYLNHSYNLHLKSLQI